MKRLKTAQEPDGSQGKFQNLKAVAAFQPSHCGLAGHIYRYI